jgi:hypothetical protein
VISAANAFANKCEIDQRRRITSTPTPSARQARAAAHVAETFLLGLWSFGLVLRAAPAGRKMLLRPRAGINERAGSLIFGDYPYPVLISANLFLLALIRSTCMI